MPPFTFWFTVDADSVRSYIPDVPVLLPASSFARYKLRTPKLPEHITMRAADSGGFVATFKWGDYRYSPEQYVAWCTKWHPLWAATMDYCCEPEVLGKTGIVEERQKRTTTMAHYFWDHFQESPWCWVPTIQGWEPEDYRKHALLMKPLIEKMSTHYGKESNFRVGIGTLCKRASISTIHQVIHVVSEVLPEVPLHLWGVKLGLLQSPLVLPRQVVSIDSAAWNGFFGKDLEKKKLSDLTQREYAFLVALPAYQAKVERELKATKQATLF